MYNYLLAKKTGGKFILRIEDTDQKRFVPEAEEYIYKSLKWLGIEPDEYPLNPGDVGPYKQSERKDANIYSPYALELIQQGLAYYAFDTEEELAALRTRLEQQNHNVGYSSHTRMSMKNSLTLSADEVQKRIAVGDPYVIRLKVPTDEIIKFNDSVHGWVSVNSKDIDDKVLMKSDGMPAYHLANVVDDHLMGVTHVLRGDEWLQSTPFHVLLYKYLGWSDTTPSFVHLPLLMGPDGKKLSKRNFKKYDFPIFPFGFTQTNEAGVEEYVPGFDDQGYDVDAVFNFLALNGWNPGDNREIMSRDEIIESFSLERLNHSGIIFDSVKLKHFQSVYFKKNPEIFLDWFQKEILRKFPHATTSSIVKVFDIAFGRSKFKHELLEDLDYFFVKPNISKDFVIDQTILSFLSQIEQIIGNEENCFIIKDKIFAAIKENGLKNGQVLKPLRYLLTGQEHGPELHNIFYVLGPNEIIERVTK